MNGGSFDIITFDGTPTIGRRIHRSHGTRDRVYFGDSFLTRHEVELGLKKGDFLEVDKIEWDIAVELLKEEVNNL